MVASLLREALANADFNVQVAHNALDATALARNFDPDIAVLDINLGEGGNGVDVDSNGRPSLGFDVSFTGADCTGQAFFPNMWYLAGTLPGDLYFTVRNAPDDVTRWFLLDATRVLGTDFTITQASRSGIGTGCVNQVQAFPWSDYTAGSPIALLKSVSSPLPVFAPPLRVSTS